MLVASLESTHGSTQEFDCPADCSGYDMVQHKEAVGEWVANVGVYVAPGGGASANGTRGCYYGGP